MALDAAATATATEADHHRETGDAKGEYSPVEGPQAFFDSPDLAAVLA